MTSWKASIHLPNQHTPHPSTTVSMHPVVPSSDIWDQQWTDMLSHSSSPGSAGPPGVDAAGCRYMCTAFNGAHKDLCDALTAMTKCICSTYCRPFSLSALIVSQLIPIDKQPGVRPIGISEVASKSSAKQFWKWPNPTYNQQLVHYSYLLAKVLGVRQLYMQCDQFLRVRTLKELCWWMHVISLTVSIVPSLYTVSRSSACALHQLALTNIYWRM